MLNGPWQIPALQKAKVDFGVAPFPVNTPDQTSIAPLGGEAWTVPVTGDNAKIAKAAELVKCMNTDENQMLRAKQGGLVPTKVALYEQYKAEVPSMAGFTDAVANARARTGKLQSEDITGGVFTISSLGGIGGRYFTPIINAPEVAILGVSRSKWQPVYRELSFVPRLMLPLSLSYDHRVIDGAKAVRFTTRLGELLANPGQLVEAIP